MQRIKNQHPTNPFHDQTNRPQSNSGNSLLFCACCWPSRRYRDNSEPNSLRQKDSTSVPFKKRTSNSLKVAGSPSVYLSLTDLNRVSSPTRGVNRLEFLGDLLSDVESINDQPYLTARTSRSADERRYRSMPELVKEIRAEFLGNQVEEMKQEFYTFFRAEKPLLKSTNIPFPSTNLQSSFNNIPPFPSIEPLNQLSNRISDSVKVLNLSSLNEELEEREKREKHETPGKVYQLQPESTRSIPQTSRSAYEVSIMPVRPFIGFLQRSIVRLPDHTYRSIVFMYWCMAYGFQKMFAYPSASNNKAIDRSSNQFTSRHI